MLNSAAYEPPPFWQMSVGSWQKGTVDTLTTAVDPGAPARQERSFCAVLFEMEA